MGRAIIKIGEYYLEWSTICDAPVTFGMDKKELHKYIKKEYGREGLELLPFRLERCDKHGSSCLPYESAEDVVWLNRAGPDESCLTVEEIYDAYCLKKPIRDGWLPK